MCSEKTTESALQNIIHTKEVFISWHGDYEVDGCGFFILIDLIRYKASNEEMIGEEFKTEEIMSALIEYENLGKKTQYLCGDSPFPEEINMLKIHSIEKLELYNNSF